jgi:hypothetical protein
VDKSEAGGAQPVMFSESRRLFHTVAYG